MPKTLFFKFKIWDLLIATFILASSIAQIAYVQSTFLNQYFSIEKVSFIFFISYTISFILINQYPNIIVRFNNSRCAIILLILEIISLLSFIFIPLKIFIFLAFLIYVIAQNLIYINFDLFIEAQSTDQATGEIRGAYLTAMNLGWVLSPFISGLILDNYGFNYLFAFVIFLTMPIIYIILLKYNKLKKKPLHKKFKFIKTLKKLFKRPNLEKIFYLMFLLQFFYAVMVIYTPIYLNQTIGLPWDQLGIIFTVMLIPFILIQYPAGYLADKYWGEKELLTIGLFIIIISLILIFLVETKSIIIWALLLFLTRIGASLLEIMSDTYFFKKINHNDIALINSYRSTRPLAYIFAPFIFGLILYIFPVHYVFLFLAAIISTGLYFALTLKDTK